MKTCIRVFVMTLGALLAGGCMSIYSPPKSGPVATIEIEDMHTRLKSSVFTDYLRTKNMSETDIKTMFREPKLFVHETDESECSSKMSKVDRQALDEGSRFSIRANRKFIIQALVTKGQSECTVSLMHFFEEKQYLLKFEDEGYGCSLALFERGKNSKLIPAKVWQAKTGSFSGLCKVSP